MPTILNYDIILLQNTPSFIFTVTFFSQNSLFSDILADVTAILFCGTSGFSNNTAQKRVFMK